MFNNNTNEKLLIELSKDLKAVAHKTGNVAQSVDNLSRVVYTDQNSLINQVTLIHQKLSNLQSETAEHANILSDQETRVRELEHKMQNMEKDITKRDKFVNHIVAAIITCVVPLLLFSTISSLNNSRFANDSQLGEVDRDE